MTVNTVKQYATSYDILVKKHHVGKQNLWSANLRFYIMSIRVIFLYGVKTLKLIIKLKIMIRCCVNMNVQNNWETELKLNTILE